LGKAAEKEGYRVGDRVVGMTRRGGCNGKYAKFSSLHVAPVSSTSLDAAEMACLVNVYMTAYQALRLGKKDGTPLTQANVLITDGYSPLGQAATQLARLEGANVWVTTNDNFEDEHMKSLGAKCLRFLPHNWLHLVKGKMDVVIDNTCIDSYESSWQALNSAGVLVCTGMTSIHDFQADGGLCGCDALGDIRDYKAKWVALKAKHLMSQTKFLDLFESFQKDPKQYRQELKYLCFLVENSMLKPIIADRIPIEDVPDAHRYLETGKVNGTIVCIV
jgi:NADPH:quinone reductase-like Zn-dependent oxidoreductase